MDLVRKALRKTNNVPKAVFKREQTSFKQRKTVKPVMKFELLSPLARTTKKNVEDALTELKNELKRMSGRVVDTDHNNNGNSNIVDPFKDARMFALSMSLKEEHILRDIIAQDPTFGMSSSSSSSE